MRRVFSLPCPFCGKGTTVKQSGLGQAHGWRVACTNIPSCAAEGPFSIESELMAKLRWNQRIQTDQVVKIDRNSPNSLNKAVASGVQVWTLNPANDTWERVREARSSDGKIEVRTERRDWQPLKQLHIGIDPMAQPAEAPTA